MNNMTLRRVFTLDTRKDCLPAWSSPRLLQLIVDDEGDSIYPLIDHVLFSFSISDFPSFSDGEIDAVYINSVAFDKESRLLVIGGDNSSGNPPLKVFDLRQGKFVWVTTNLSDDFVQRSRVVAERLEMQYGPRVIQAPVRWVGSVAINAKEKFIIVRANTDDDAIIKYSLSGELLAENVGINASKIVITPDGSSVIAISGGDLLVLDPSSVSVTRSVKASSSHLSSVAFNRDATILLAISEEGEIISTDLNLNKLWSLTVDAIPRCVQYDSYSDCFFVGTNLGDLIALNEKGLQLEHSRVSESIRDIAFLHEGRHVLVGCKNMDIHVFANESRPVPNDEARLWEERLHDTKTSTYTSTSTLTDARIFISYSSSDKEFIRVLEAKLTANGLTCWRDEHSLVSGRITKQISRAIMDKDVVLVILSTNSLSSDWVRWELDTAREVEKRTGKDIICPIAIDLAWHEWSDDPVLKREVLKYHIVSFQGWESKELFEENFARLITGLRMNYLTTDEPKIN